MASMPTTQPNNQSSAMPSLTTNNGIPRMSDTICYSTPVLSEFSQDFVTHQAWPNPPSSHIDKLGNLFMCPDEGRLVSTLAAMQQCTSYVDPSFTDPSSKLAASGSLLAYMTAANNGTGNGHIMNSISEAMARMGNNAAGKVGHSSLMGSPCSLPMCDMEKLLSSNWLAGGSSLNPSDDLGLTVDPSKGGLALGHAASHPLAAFSSGPAFPERAAKFSPFGNQAYGEPTQGYIPNDHAGPMARDSKVISNQASLTRAQSISGAQASNAIPDNGSMQEGTSTRVEDSKLVPVDRQNQALCRGSTASPSQVEAFQNSQKHCTSLNDSDESTGQEGSSSCERDVSGCGVEAAMQAGFADDLSGKKRRVGSKDRSKNGARPANVGKDLESNEGKCKRLKGGNIVPEDESKPNVEQSNSVNSGESTPKSVKECSKPPEPPKPDYIHVRARRGQATDSHSLAERVRREKISERMKYLQDLVPGCSKVTGKAVMLDEIINYVQSLQRQVEFLSMKLAAVNPRLEFNIDGIFAREALPARAPPQPFLLTPDNPNSHPLLSHPHQQPPQPPSLQVGGLCPPAEVHPFTSDPALRRTMSTPVTSVEAFGDPVSQVWDDELQNVVQMGFPQGRQGSSPTPLQGQLFHGQLKVEL